MIRKLWFAWWRMIDNLTHDPYREVEVWAVIAIAIGAMTIGGATTALVVSKMTNDVLGWIAWCVILVCGMLVLVSIEFADKFCPRERKQK